MMKRIALAAILSALGCGNGLSSTNPAEPSATLGGPHAYVVSVEQHHTKCPPDTVACGHSCCDFDSVCVNGGCCVPPHCPLAH